MLVCGWFVFVAWIAMIINISIGLHVGYMCLDVLGSFQHRILEPFSSFGSTCEPRVWICRFLPPAVSCEGNLRGSGVFCVVCMFYAM